MTATIRPRNRFEVFKRDGFQCQYCGRRVPDVTLEVDHIAPRSAGGRDTLDNLVTACFECNRGKGDKSLREGLPAIDYRTKAADAKERQRQVKAYFESERQVAEEIEKAVADIANFWETWIGPPTQGHRARFHTFISKLGPAKVREAITVVAAQRRRQTIRDVTAYFCAICWKWIREATPTSQT